MNKKAFLSDRHYQVEPSFSNAEKNESKLYSSMLFAAKMYLYIINFLTLDLK